MDKRRLLKSWIFILLLSLFLTFYQLPYYVTTPGMAKTLSPIIEVDGGYEIESGNFMLTTVRIGKANIVQYGWAKLNDYHHIYTEEELRPHGESDDEYHERQLHMMDTSKETSTYVAYKHAGKKVEMKTIGVYVLRVFENMPAHEKLQVGDRIYSIDQIDVKNAEDLIDYVSNQTAGKTVTVKLEREGKVKNVDIKLERFKKMEGKVGMGIQLVTDREIEVEPKIEIDTDQIGGPSAGLMFSLEIYNQLVKEDITKGYEIAGTGTINTEGQVGRIGGIEQKVVAANQSGAEIFFAPNENGIKGSNYQEALSAAKDIDAKMKIIPVDTFKEAIHYLQTLKPKNI